MRGRAPRALALVVMGLVAAGDASAASEPAQAPAGALSCSGCHGAGTSVPSLAGRSADEIVAALDAYRAGTRPATVMNRIAPGFTPEESRAIAVWMSARAP
jgi:sulfide dehydrogenase cytochrome subunit